MPSGFGQLQMPQENDLRQLSCVGVDEIGFQLEDPANVIS